MGKIKLLDKLSELDMSVHIVSNAEQLPVYLALKKTGTHCIMQGERIVFVGNMRDIPTFVNRIYKETDNVIKTWL